MPNAEPRAAEGVDGSTTTCSDRQQRRLDKGTSHAATAPHSLASTQRFELPHHGVMHMRLMLSRPQPKINTTALIGGVGVGAALMYYLDPARGARRRSTLRDKLVRVASVTSDAVDSTKHALGNRARGLLAEGRALGSDDEAASDDVLEARVRSAAGHVISHPDAVEIHAANGVVTLTGDIEASRVRRLMRRVWRIRGVKEVHSQLRVLRRSDEPSHTKPELVEERERDLELRSDHWEQAARLLTNIAGGAMTIYGVVRRDKFGSAVGLAGLALLTRDMSDGEMGERLSRNGIDIQKTITIDASPDKVFAFLTEWERFPEWMSHVRSVRSLGGRGAVGERTRWEVDGPTPGTTIEWEAITTRFEPNKLITWKSGEHEPIRQAGRMRIEPNELGGTRLRVELRYRPPLGRLGHALAAVFKRDPRHQLDDDIGRLKSVIETGNPSRDGAAREDDIDEESGSTATTSPEPGAQ